MAKYPVDANFELIGGFWVPKRRKATFTGFVTSQKGLVEIKTSPVYKNFQRSKHRPSPPDISGRSSLDKIDTLQGFTTNNECTLFNVLLLQEAGMTNYAVRQAVTNRHMRAMRTVMGLHLESSDSESLDSGALYFRKIHRLMPTPWKTDFSSASTTYTAPHESLEVFRFTCRSLDSEVICEVFSGGSSRFNKAVHLASVPRIRINPKGRRSVDWFASVAFRVENFFSLILGTSTSVKYVQLFAKKKEGWLVQTMKRRDEKVNLQTWVRCKFADTATALDKWLSIPDDRQLVELNLLGIMRKSDVFSETEFLTLAQTLEGFGRIKFGGSKPREAKFADLIRKTYDMLNPEFAAAVVGDRNSLIQTVIQTRDYYTHIGNPKGKAVAKGMRDLFLLNKRLQSLLRCVMLLDLGIPEDALREPITYQANRWK